MNLMHYKIERLQELKALLREDNEQVQALVRQANIKNKWFTEEIIWQSIHAICNEFLYAEKLQTYLQHYPLQEVHKNIGIIAAGNLPLVGFQDVLAVFLVNAPCQIKLSSKDEVLMRFVIESLAHLDITWQVDITERLQNFDAVIATGSNNTHRYFEQYFSKVPNILRGHRNSIAVLNGKESAQELAGLAKDVCSYFGMGCRNVSKIWVPKDYDVTQLFPYFDAFKEMVNHNLYKDNYDYNRTLLLMNLDAHLANDFIILKEDSSLHSRLATVHYSFYEKEIEVQNYIIDHNQDIQVVMSKPNTLWASIPFGKAQEPGLLDYADNIDTMEFLLGLG